MAEAFHIIGWEEETWAVFAHAQPQSRYRDKRFLGHAEYSAVRTSQFLAGNLSVWAM